MVLKIIGIILCLIVIGLIKEKLSLQRLKKDAEFLQTYNRNYVKYVDNYLGRNIRSEEETQLYREIISYSPKAQRLLGTDGLMTYAPAGAGYMHHQYQVLVNTVQALRNPMLMSEEFKWVNNLLVMKLTSYAEAIDNIKGNMKNPLVLLREGVQFFITLPISLLYWTGIIQYYTQYKISNNFFFKFVSYLIVLIGFISSIFTIVLGWEQFKEYLYRWF